MTIVNLLHKTYRIFQIHLLSDLYIYQRMWIGWFLIELIQAARSQTASLLLDSKTWKKVIRPYIWNRKTMNSFASVVVSSVSSRGPLGLRFSELVIRGIRKYTRTNLKSFSTVRTWPKDPITSMKWDISAPLCSSHFKTHTINKTVWMCEALGMGIDAKRQHASLLAVYVVSLSHENKF